MLGDRCHINITLSLKVCTSSGRSFVFCQLWLIFSPTFFDYCSFNPSAIVDEYLTYLVYQIWSSHTAIFCRVLFNFLYRHNSIFELVSQDCSLQYNLHLKRHIFRRSFRFLYGPELNYEEACREIGAVCCRAICHAVGSQLRYRIQSRQQATCVASSYFCTRLKVDRRVNNATAYDVMRYGHIVCRHARPLRAVWWGLADR